MGVVVYPPDMMWDVMMQRPHHILIHAAKDGHQVYFGDKTAKRSYSPKENITVVNDQSCVPKNVDVLYLTSPWQYEWCKGMRVKKVIYDCCDHRNGKDHDIIKNADVVIATSLGLKEMIVSLGRKDVIYLPNACDFEHFNIDDGEREDAVCYMGIISPDVLDFSLMLALQNVNLFSIGQVSSIANISLTGKYYGHVNYSELPQYLKMAKVGIIPFRLDTDFTKYAAPVKVYEYLAAGLSVVSTPIPELKPLAEKGIISMAPENDVSAWKEAVYDALSLYPNIKGKEWAKNQTWDNRWLNIKEEFQCR